MNIELTLKVLFFLLFNGFMGYVHLRASKTWMGHDTLFSEQVVGAGIFYFSQITLTVQILGLTGRYLTPVNLISLNFVLCGILLYKTEPLGKTTRKSITDFFKMIKACRDWAAYVLLALLAARILLSLAHVSILPPVVYDVLTYHLTPAVEWYQQHRIPVQIPTDVDRVNAMSLGVTILSYWFFIFFSDSALVELPQLLWSIILLPVSYGLLRKWQVPRIWAVKFSIGIYFIPSVILQSVAAKDHLALNTSFIAALLFALIVIDGGQLKNLWFLGMSLGLCLGYKLSAPAHVLICWVLFALLALWHNRPLFFEKSQRTELVKHAIVSWVFTCAIGGYWYIRNLWLHRSIRGTYLEGHHDMVPESILNAISRHFRPLWQHLENMIPAWLDFRSLYHLDLAYISGFGPIFITFGLFGLLTGFHFLLIKRQWLARKQLLFYPAIALTLIYYSLWYSPWDYRLLSFFPILLIIYAAIFLHENHFFRRAIPRLGIQALLLFCVTFTFISLAVPFGVFPERVKAFFDLPTRLRTSAYFAAIDSVSPYYFIQKTIPVEEPVAYITNKDTMSYVLYDRKWKRSILALLPEKHYRIVSKNFIEVSQEAKNYLKQNRVRLVCTYLNLGRQFSIKDPDFIKLYPGLYSHAKR